MWNKDEGHALNWAHDRSVSDVGPGTVVHIERRCIDRLVWDLYLKGRRLLVIQCAE